jgi:hypothetical protein
VFEPPISNPNVFNVTPETQQPTHSITIPMMKYFVLIDLPVKTLKTQSMVVAPPIVKQTVPMMSKIFERKRPIWDRKITPYNGKKTKIKPKIPR